MLAIRTQNGAPVSDIAAKTDENGFVDQPVPPSAILATVSLHPEKKPEKYRFELGGIDPIDEVSGWQARLNNLGYNCGKRDGLFDEKTKASIQSFQRSRGIPDSGIMDEITLKALNDLALS